MVTDIAERMARFGGAGLIIDYGHIDSGTKSTLQAVRAHDYADPLSALGEIDLTAHVDFAELARAVREAGGKDHGPITQSRFLNAVGMRQRGEALLARATPEQIEDIQSAYRRLVHPDEMGILFKVLGISHPDYPTLPGFEPVEEE